MTNFSESQDWLHFEEAKKRNQINKLEESFYSSRARVGITGFIFDCIAGKQEEVDLEAGARIQAETVEIQPNFMEEPITFALVSSTQMIMSAVSGITNGISNLFSWGQPSQQQITQTQPDTTNPSKTTDLLEVVIEGEIQRTLENIQRSYEKLPTMEKEDKKSLSTTEIESPKMSDIFSSNIIDNEAEKESKAVKTAVKPEAIIFDKVDSSEYVDSGNYWYQGPEVDDDDDDEDLNRAMLSNSFYAMESYIDFCQDDQIVAKSIEKKRKKAPNAKVHFEPMVELMDNVINNDKAAIKRILLEGVIKVNDQDKLGYTMLHYAASHGHLDLIKFLVEKGGNINALDFTNWTPLHLAAIADNYKACKVLLDLGANFECPNDDENLPVDLTEDAKVKKLLSDATKKKLSAKKVKVIYDFAAGSPEYLNLKKSETVKVIERRQEWWLVQNEDKQIGLVPRTYVQ